MNKKTLSESDICDKFIRPAMESAGWDGMSQIYREYPLRAGRVVVRGRRARRDASTVLRADYALFFKPNIPLAVVEAKDNSHAVGAGMAQAINYAQLLDVPFSFASNGDGFVFRDATLADGVLERNLTLDEFPSPAELWARYCAWKGWTPDISQVAEQTTRQPRRRATTRSTPSTARWKPSPAARTGRCWSWPPAPARPTPPSRSSGGCGRAAPRSASCSWPTGTS
jgi:type I site-specific restriction endonuclease